MFALTDSQLKKAKKWIKLMTKEKPSTNDEMRFSYIFTPGSIGISIFILDNQTNSRLELTDYSSW